MAKKDKGPGFQQAAGLMRYFDAEEETALKVNPYVVIGMGFAFGAIILLLDYIY